jgi:hypothetical protein
MNRKKEVSTASNDALLFVYQTFLAIVLLGSLVTINFDFVKKFFALDTRSLTASASMVVKPEVVDGGKLTGEAERAFLESYHITEEAIAPLREEQDK